MHQLCLKPMLQFFLRLSFFITTNLRKIELAPRLIESSWNSVGKSKVTLEDFCPCFRGIEI